MQPPQSKAHSHRVIATSHLGRSLLRLHRRMEQTREEEARVETLFQHWEESWSSHRDELTRRLEMLEHQLAHLGEPAVPAPRLSVVRFPPDAAEMRSM
jgi:hypothetical protein